MGPQSYTPSKARTRRLLADSPLRTKTHLFRRQGGRRPDWPRSISIAQRTNRTPKPVRRLAAPQTRVEDPRAHIIYSSSQSSAKGQRQCEPAKQPYCEFCAMRTKIKNEDKFCAKLLVKLIFRIDKNEDENGDKVCSAPPKKCFAQSHRALALNRPRSSRP